MRRLNVTNKRPKKTGVIYRDEQVQQRKEDKKLAASHKKTERLVYVGGYNNAYTNVKKGETDETAKARYRSKHREDFPNETNDLIPIKYLK